MYNGRDGDVTPRIQKYNFINTFNLNKYFFITSSHIMVYFVVRIQFGLAV